METNESTDLNDDIKEHHDQNNTAFLQLATLCQSYCDFLNTKNLTPNPSEESICIGTLVFLLYIYIYIF